MKLIGSYVNGNYQVTILDDGTKIRTTKDSEFRPDRVESFDCKITNKCFGTGIDGKGCPQCHEMSTPDGKHGNLDNPMIKTIPPYTEIAIGGGNPLCHPDLEKFLIKLKGLRCFPNMTVNQVHFIQDYEKLSRYRDNKLIYGLGISLVNADEDFAKKVKEFPNAVIHVIAGIVSLEQLQKLSELGIRKILILGYKQFGRGKDFYSEKIQQKIEELKKEMPNIIKMFEVVSFDNLAIKQLDVKSLMSEEEWNEFYMGDDGFATFYIDLVKEEYALSSTSEERFPLKESVQEMFYDIRRKNGIYKS